MSARETLPGISFSRPVYNSLRFLKDAGLVREIAFGNGASRYESRDGSPRSRDVLRLRQTRLIFDLPGTVALIVRGPGVV